MQSKRPAPDLGVAALLGILGAGLNSEVAHLHGLGATLVTITGTTLMIGAALYAIGAVASTLRRNAKG